MDERVQLGRERILARSLLGSNLERWAHVCGVAEAAANVSLTVRSDEVQLLINAAWLHDIGYAASVRHTGFHPLDGARHLRSVGAQQRICRLVANHTHAWVEAEMRGLSDALAAEFPRERSPLSDSLTYADLTTSPAGATTCVEFRLADIYDRYPPSHVVHQSIRRAEPELIATVRRVEARLAVAQPR